MAYGYGDEMGTDISKILDMYQMITDDWKDEQKAVKKINLTISLISSLNLSAFTEVENIFLYVKMEISDIIAIMQNTSIQLKPDPNFLKLADELIHELSEPKEVINIDLIKECLKDFLSIVLKRIDTHNRAMGLVRFLLASELKMSSSMLTKLEKDVRGAIGFESKEESFEFNEDESLF